MVSAVCKLPKLAQSSSPSNTIIYMVTFLCFGLVRPSRPPLSRNSLHLLCARRDASMVVTSARSLHGAAEMRRDQRLGFSPPRMSILIYRKSQLFGYPFTSVPLASATLLFFFFTFRAQSFSQRVHRDCLEAARGMLASADVAYLLSFSVVSKKRDRWRLEPSPPFPPSPCPLTQ